MTNGLRFKSRGLLLAVAVVATAQAQQIQPVSGPHAGDSVLRVYDSFHAATINPSLWFVENGCSDKTTLECVRQIEEHQLDLRVRAYGDRDSNGGMEYGHSELMLADQTAGAIAADLTVLKADTAGCVTSPGAGTHGHAILFGSFFNDGTGTAAGDVQALLVVDRYSTDPVNVVEAGAFLQYQGSFLDFVDLGSVNVGEPFRIELRWDKANHRFLASLTHLANHSTVTVPLPYSSADYAPPVVPGKGIGVRSFPENCNAGATFVDMEARFQRVLVDRP